MKSIYYNIFLVLFTYGICAYAIQDSIGNFWHLTDIHFDRNYSREGDPNDLCHLSNKSADATDNGLYGNFLCDSPHKLVELTINFMKLQAPKPDFIIWTGDNLAHTRHPSPDWTEILQDLKNITYTLKSAFPDVPIYPSIGNHDTFPPNILDPKNCSSVYEDYLKDGGWDTILDDSTLPTFKCGGYYSHSPMKNLRIINLNTILWYSVNSLANIPTNHQQIEFLKEELKDALNKKEMVYIIGHVSPGFYNRNHNNAMSDPLYYLPYLKDYLDVIKMYKSVIKGQFFGHIHNDMFQLYTDNNGETYGSGLLAPSVTPWYSNYGKNINVTLPVNPSVRLMQFNKETLVPVDYNQYFLNLTKANMGVSMNPQENPNYELLYSFQNTYGVPDLSSDSLVSVFEELKVNETLFKTFFKYLTAAKESVDCDKACQNAQLCSMGAVSSDAYVTCMQSDNGGSPNESHHAMAYIISSICIVFAIVIVSALICYKRKVLWFRKNISSDSYSEL